MAATCVVLSLVASVGLAQSEASVVPPQVLKRVEATYPFSALEARREGTAILRVTLSETGEVVATEVSQSAGEALDQAAIEAVKQWSFVPAQQAERPIRSRIEIPFHFVLPEPQPDPAPGAVSEDAAQREGLPPPLSTVVHGNHIPAPRASSDVVLNREVLGAAPHQTAADLLGAAPGIYVSAPEGDAVGHEIYLRGFDADHGQDMELTVGPVPVNQPSHIHGQGYSDLNFIIPETVRSLRVTEGVYDPRQGDFAVAGSVHFDLAVPERGTHLKTRFGSFGQVRQLLLWAPKDEPSETFGAFAFQRTNGFGQNRGAQSVSALGQYSFGGPAGFEGRLHIAAYGSRANLAGVLRWDDVDAGKVDFWGSYPDPSANSQSAFANRYQAALTFERQTEGGARTRFSTWVVLANFRGRFNFTGYLERSRTNPDWLGRGDLIEQGNRDLGLGALLTHRTERVRPWAWANGRIEMGLSARTNAIEQTQNLLRAPQNETWDQRVDAGVQASDVGVYADLEAHFWQCLHLRGGFRSDVLHYDVDDRLGNFIPRFQRESHLLGYRRTALGLAAGPRASLTYEPLSALAVIASYGEGYRSPQALQLEEGENAPFTKVRAWEVGFRLKGNDSERLSFTAAAYQTHLSDDLAFDPGEARMERIGPTRRQGVSAHLLTNPVRWFLASISATYVRATLMAPPVASAENPSPPFQPGQALPYVPPWVVRGDLAFMGGATLFNQSFHLRWGSGLTYLSPRPLPFGRFADRLFLLDTSVSVRWRWVEVGVDVFNLLNQRYAASEYSFVSDWGNREAPSLIPSRHFAAGAPRALLGFISIRL